MTGALKNKVGVIVTLLAFVLSPLSFGENSSAGHDHAHTNHHSHSSFSDLLAVLMIFNEAMRLYNQNPLDSKRRENLEQAYADLNDKNAEFNKAVDAGELSPDAADAARAELAEGIDDEAISVANRLLADDKEDFSEKIASEDLSPGGDPLSLAFTPMPDKKVFEDEGQQALYLHYINALQNLSEKQLTMLENVVAKKDEIDPMVLADLQRSMGISIANGGSSTYQSQNGGSHFLDLKIEKDEKSNEHKREKSALAVAVAYSGPGAESSTPKVSRRRLAKLASSIQMADSAKKIAKALTQKSKTPIKKASTKEFDPELSEKLGTFEEEKNKVKLPWMANADLTTQWRWILLVMVALFWGWGSIMGFRFLHEKFMVPAHAESYEYEPKPQAAPYQTIIKDYFKNSVVNDQTTPVEGDKDDVPDWASEFRKSRRFDGDEGTTEWDIQSNIVPIAEAKPVGGKLKPNQFYVKYEADSKQWFLLRTDPNGEITNWAGEIRPGTVVKGAALGARESFKRFKLGEDGKWETTSEKEQFIVRVRRGNGSYEVRFAS